MSDKHVNPLHLSNLVAMVISECNRARNSNAPFNSLHEAYAVLQEEVDEFWDEVKKKPTNRSRDNTRKELIQIAAMALCTIAELVDPNWPE